MLGTDLWNKNSFFYDGLTLAADGIAPEQAFAARPGLASQFKHYEVFWRRHVCPATTRPHGVDFRPGISDIVSNIARKSFSILNKLLDADESLSSVLAGDVGERYRNWRDAIEAAGNALQLNTDLQYAIEGNPKHAKVPSLAGTLGLVIDLFPDWKSAWAAERETATKYRHALVHDGMMYTVTALPTLQTLVLGRDAFAAGINWHTASASYDKRPQDWQTIDSVCAAVVADTVAFIDLTYERLIDKMAPLLTNPAYQQLWGWNNSTVPTAMVVKPTSAVTPVTVTLHASSAAKTVISSGPCMP